MSAGREPCGENRHGKETAGLNMHAMLWWVTGGQEGTNNMHNRVFLSFLGILLGGAGLVLAHGDTDRDELADPQAVIEGIHGHMARVKAAKSAEDQRAALEAFAQYAGLARSRLEGNPAVLEAFAATWPVFNRMLGEVDYETIEPVIEVVSVVVPHSEEAFERLVELMLKEVGEAETSRYREPLQRMDHPSKRSLEMLAEAMGEVDGPANARTAAAILAHHGPGAREAFPLLVGILHEGLPVGVPFLLPQVLAAVGGEESIPYLVEALDAESTVVRSEAANALATIGDPAIPVLAANLHRDLFAPARALASLGMAALPALETACASNDLITRQNALFAIGLIPQGNLTESCRELLLDMMHDPDPGVRCWVLNALRRFDDEKAFACLEETAASGTYGDKVHADRQQWVNDWRREKALPPKEELPPPLHRLEMRRIESENPAENPTTVEVYFRLEGQKEAVLIGQRQLQDGFSMGIDDDSIRVGWVKADSLAEVTYSTTIQGNAKNTARGILLLERQEGTGWRLLYKHMGMGAQGGLGSGGSTCNYVGFRWDRSRDELIFVHRVEIWETSSLPAPLFVETGNPRFPYEKTLAVVTSWPCTLTADGLVMEEGTSVLEMKKPYDFPVFEAARSGYGDRVPGPEELVKVVAGLTAINLQLGNRAFFTESIVTSTTVPPHQPDLTNYLYWNSL